MTTQYMIWCSSDQCYLEESITFKIGNASLYGDGYTPISMNIEGNQVWDIYEDGVLIDSDINGTNGYVYTPSSIGTHSIEVKDQDNDKSFGVVSISVETKTLTTYFSKANAVYFRGNRVKQIVRTSNNALVYQLEESSIFLIITLTEGVSITTVEITTEDANGDFVPLSGDATLRFYINNTLVTSFPGSFSKSYQLQLNNNDFNIGDVIHFEIPTKNLISNSVTFEGIYKDYIELKMSPHDFSSYPGTFQDDSGPSFINENNEPTDVYIDWGDSSSIEHWVFDSNDPYRSISHTYQEPPTSEDPEYGYIVKVYGDIYQINPSHFIHFFKYTKLSNTIKELKRIGSAVTGRPITLIISKSVEQIDSDTFIYTPNLTDIVLTWTELNNIVPYNSEWQKSIIDPMNPSSETIIEYRFWQVPYGTRNLYLQKGYPSQYLIEMPE